MNIMSFRELKRITVDRLSSIIPVILTVNGVEMFLVEHKDQVIAIGDMHPIAKGQLRARENLIRMGMPKPEVVKTEVRLSDLE